MEIDFSPYDSFSSTPVWWRNFVNISCNDISDGNTKLWNKRLDESLQKYNCKIVGYDCGTIIDYLVFESAEDFLAFKLRWV